jgi:hypothetical protein
MRYGFSFVIRHPQDKQRAMFSNASSNFSLIPVAKALAKSIACLRIVLIDLNKLRSGYFQPVNNIQCWIITTISLAYNSQSIRHCFSLRHLSICQRVRINIRPSSKLNNSDGIFVQITVQSASFNNLMLGVSPLRRRFSFILPRLASPTSSDTLDAIMCQWHNINDHLCRNNNEQVAPH